MNVDEAIKLLENEGFEVRQRRKITVDASFLGHQLKSERLDSPVDNTTLISDLEQLRLDAQNARQEMIDKLSPSANQKDNYDSKSTEVLRDIARANRDLANDRLEGYRA